MGVSDGGPAEMTFTKYLSIGHLEWGDEKELFLHYPGTFWGLKDRQVAQTTWEGSQGGVRDDTWTPSV